MNDTLHVAIIPDGNRRWAKQNGLKGYYDLYQRGIDGMLDISEAAFKLGVTHLSLWGSSHANMSGRNADFVQNLDRVFRENIRRFATHPIIAEYDISIRVVGEWRDSFTPETVRVMEDAIVETARRTGCVLTLLIDYSGSRERDAAVAELRLDPLKHTTLREYAWTSYLPDLNLAIRTGSWTDPHNSEGFLSLLSDNTQFAYPEVLWPDFTPKHLADILADYNSREKRGGK
ncbi:undecaprenyl diphosphate synthase family protein [Candidatus Saccharibacteria bacterium]|nr:undecaprenyl diphosphate synthase family protein [Candidatus Saccharibacteria bacterium]